MSARPNIIRRIIVINVKGGCGKTTIATNLASMYAVKGFGVSLFDYDPQGSSLHWLKQRSGNLPPVFGVVAHNAQSSVMRTFALRTPPHVNRIVVDTPAGIKGHRLAEQLKDNDIVIIPVIPSAIDIHATADFMRDLILVAKARTRRMRLAIVANRVRPATTAMQSFETFLYELNVPVVARLRDDVNYMLAAEQGLGVHEMALTDLAETQRFQSTWTDLYDWVEAAPQVTPIYKPEIDSRVGATPAPTVSGNEGEGV